MLILSYVSPTLKLRLIIECDMFTTFFHFLLLVGSALHLFLLIDFLSIYDADFADPWESVRKRFLIQIFSQVNDQNEYFGCTIWRNNWGWVHTCLSWITFRVVWSRILLETRNRFWVSFCLWIGWYSLTSYYRHQVT